MVTVERREWPALDTDSEAIKNMARAALLRAVRDEVNYRNTKNNKLKKVHQDVHEWIFDKHDDPQSSPLDQLMSFEGICDILGWDPDWLRRRVRTLSPEDLARLGKNGTGLGR
jgi:hypothetical protein